MPNYVTFKILESWDGDFVLYLHNHKQKLISEQYRSGDLDEVVDMLKEKIDYRRHFMNALNNYAPVLQASNKLEDKYPDGNKGEDCPVGSADPWIYMGFISVSYLSRVWIYLKRDLIYKA